MNNDYRAQFLVGSFTAVTAALVSMAVSGQINWLWLILAFVVPFLVLSAYQGVISLNFRPFKSWGIREGELTSYSAKKRGNAWEFDRNSRDNAGFNGPYIPVLRGKYRVTFRLMIDERSEQDQPVCELAVTSNDGRKWFAKHTVSVRDFVRAERWQNFSLDFTTLRDENRVEFRFQMKEPLLARKRISFQGVTLRRRVF
jgi:hypothetical protein